MRECGNVEGIVAGIMAGCVVWRLDRSHDHAGRVIMPVGALPRSAHETAPAVQAGDHDQRVRAQVEDVRRGVAHMQNVAGLVEAV